MFGKKIDLKSIESATRVEQARTAVYRFKSELAELKNSAPPEKEIEKALDAALDRLAARGRDALPVRGLVSPGWNEEKKRRKDDKKADGKDDKEAARKDDEEAQKVKAKSPRFSPELSESDLLGLIVAVARDQVRALVIEKAEAALGSRKSLTPSEQAKKVEAVKAKLLAAELEEESLIRAAEYGGVEVLRRADADPRATLGA